MRAAFIKGVALLACVVLGACASIDTLSPEREADLVRRASERAELMFSGDYEWAWEYSSPNYRSVFPKHLFAKQFSSNLERRLTGV